MTTTPDLILASSSPRRHELLRLAGLSFVARPTEVDESISLELEPKEIPTHLAYKKALPLIDESRTAVIVGADTIVLLDDTILGKPADLEDARRMLSRLSGRSHIVITGVCLLYQDQKVLFRESTLVYFRSLSRDEIDRYVETARPLDKAGAYGIQEEIGLKGVTRIEGCFYNVMGLPVQRLWLELNQLLANQ